ncbi:MAG: hypothetical protein ACERK9_13255, partial [Deltaproteobacteria bacterium]
MPFLLISLNHATFLPMGANSAPQLKGQTKRRLMQGMHPLINRQQKFQITNIKQITMTKIVRA